MRVSSKLIVIVTFIFVSSCSSMPQQIQLENTSFITLQSVQQEQSNYKGQTVRWGGVITQVINNENDTWIEILALQLTDSGRPTGNRTNNYGRFIAKVDQFLDPEVYQNGNSVTVLGVITGKVDGKVGDFNYSYPLVEVQGHYLWPVIRYNNFNMRYAPGYWYHGMYSYHGYHGYHGNFDHYFGFNYYGYGVRHHHFYYPYYPFYGHLTRQVDRISNSKPSGVFVRNNEYFSILKESNNFRLARNNQQTKQRLNTQKGNRKSNYRHNSMQRNQAAPVTRRSSSTRRSVQPSRKTENKRQVNNK